MPELYLHPTTTVTVAELRPSRRALLRLDSLSNDGSGLVSDNPPLFIHLNRTEALPALDGLAAEIARVRAELVTGMGL